MHETWLKLVSPLDYFNLENYCLETVNRIDCQVEGVGLYVLHGTDYKLRGDLKCQNEIYKSLFIEVNRLNHKNIITGVVYRHHHHGINEFNNQLKADISKINTQNKLLYLTGDFNINILKDNEKYIDDFLDMMYSIHCTH